MHAHCIVQHDFKSQLIRKRDKKVVVNVKKNKVKRNYYCQNVGQVLGLKRNTIGTRLGRILNVIIFKCETVFVDSVTFHAYSAEPIAMKFGINIKTNRMLVLFIPIPRK